MHIILLILIPLVAAKGNLLFPPPRQEGAISEPLQDPKTLQICRVPAGNGQEITKLTPNQKLTIKLQITERHQGPCALFLYPASDLNEDHAIKLEEKFNCANEVGTLEWPVMIPMGINGHWVLRWYWENWESSSAQRFENCADVQFEDTSSLQRRSDGCPDGKFECTKGQAFRYCNGGVWVPGSCLQANCINSGGNIACE